MGFLSKYLGTSFLQTESRAGDRAEDRQNCCGLKTSSRTKPPGVGNFGMSKPLAETGRAPGKEKSILQADR